jgi:uncharacterized membrane protein YdjX (TVP38/TMEM64 family)
MISPERRSSGPDPSSADTPPPRAEGKERRFFKGVVQLLILSVGIGVMYLPPVREQLANVPEISERLRTFGWAAPALFVPAVALLVAVGVPRLLLCPIGGMAFGFFWGLVWTLAGTLLGFWATFVVVRRFGQDWVLRKWPRLQRFTRISRRNGMVTVLLIRQLPITGFYVNYLLGLLPLSHRDFLLGTALGILPEAIPATMVGANALYISSDKGVYYSVLVVAVFILVWTLSARFLRFWGVEETEGADAADVSSDEKRTAPGPVP